MDKIKKVVDQAYDYVLDNILTGAWPVGSKIPPETELAATLGISRMTLRSAIQRTNALGLTETKQGEGTYVTSFNMYPYFSNLFELKLISNKNNDILLFRNYMEVGSIYTAFSQPDFDKKVERLEALFREVKDILYRRNLDAFHAVDAAFHSTIWSMSGNQFIHSLTEALDQLIRENMQYNAELLYDPDNPEILLDSHREILEAIKKKDIEGCYRAKFKHWDILLQARESK